MGDVCQRTGSAQWKILVGVLDVEVVLRTILEVGAHQPGEMPDGEGDVVDPGCFELVQQDLEDGFVADRHHRLGEDFGVGGEAGAFSSGENHSMHLLTPRKKQLNHEDTKVFKGGIRFIGIVGGFIKLVN